MKINTHTCVCTVLHLRSANDGLCPFSIYFSARNAVDDVCLIDLYLVYLYIVLLDVFTWYMFCWWCLS